MDEHSGIYKFVSVGELAETTTQMLAFGLQTRTKLGSGQTADGRNEHSIERVEQLILQQARDYLAEVREGFVLSVRATKVTNAAELQFLLERVLLDWSTLSRQLGFEEPTEEDTPSTQPTLERVRQQLLAYGMAASALAQLPRLPAEQITFPYSYSKPPTYADIPAPDSPGDMLWRIEELEQMIWRLMSEGLQSLLEQRYGALRRTYGFFETSAHLANREAERFGIKPRSKGLLLL